VRLGLFEVSSYSSGCFHREESTFSRLECLTVLVMKMACRTLLETK
jgi:hypothetical protein